VIGTPRVRNLFAKGIEGAQAKALNGTLKKLINSIQKSKDRLKNALKNIRSVDQGERIKTCLTYPVTGKMAR
jgi:hypothetical protein